MSEQFTVDYFIAKFEAIAPELWNGGLYVAKDGTRCAMGHCGVMPDNRYKETPESSALDELFWKHQLIVVAVNDGADSRYIQSTPKQRILAALRDIKSKSQPQNPTPTETMIL
jgi:hypothetical protein